MESKDLAIFVQVVQSGNFSAAAGVLALTPSAISKAVTRLEDQLGRRLLHRSSRSMHLTDEGRDFLQAAYRVIDAMEEAEAVGSTAASGTLRIRSVPTFAQYQLAPLMPALIRAHPGLRIEFLLGNERTAWLDDGADVAIASGDLPASNFIARRIATSRWIICASPAYLAEHGTPGTPKDLAQHRCLNFSMPTDWNHWNAESGNPGRIVSNQGDMLLALARAGAGIVRLAEFHISQELQAGRLVPVLTGLDDGDEETLFVIYRDRRHLSRRVRVFLDFIIEAFTVPPWKTPSLQRQNQAEITACHAVAYCDI